MSKNRRRILGAIDTDVKVAVEKFLDQGVAPDVNSLYQALQRSNSSLKRKPKRLLEDSIERVLQFLNADREGSSDSDAAIEKEEARTAKRLEREQRQADMMNRSLRANLASVPTSPGLAQPNGTEGSDPKRLITGQAKPKRQRVSADPPADISLNDIGGVDGVIDQLRELLVLPLLQPEIYAEAKIGLPRGILLHGPPGCGKTMISRAFAATLGVPFIEILGPSIVSGMSGESEKGIRERFDEAKRNAPCLIFIDEIDAIAPKRESSQSQMERRIVAQLLLSIDELERYPLKPVIVLAATNRPDSLDPALRRGGRFDTEINIGVPNEGVRALILKAQTRDAVLSSDVNFDALAKRTAGYVGADLHDLVNKAGSWQMSRFREAMELEAQHIPNGHVMEVDGDKPMKLSSALLTERLVARARQRNLPRPAGFEQFQIGMQAFEAVLPTITPSSKREGFTTVPDVSWDDIGALRKIREELQVTIVGHIRSPEMYEKVGITRPASVLLWGPPGCGKTLLAKAVAGESQANFISINGPELLNKYVGESERAVRQVFVRARSSRPVIIFFDELDALVPRRDDSMSEASSRVVNTLLTELDGMNERNGIFVIAATNRPDVIDEAMLRPGRLDTCLFIDLPGPDERVEIMRKMMRKKPVSSPEDVLRLVATDKCAGYSGADLDSLLAKAAQLAIKSGRPVVHFHDFERACSEIQGSVRDMKKYHALKGKFGR